MNNDKYIKVINKIKSSKLIFVMQEILQDVEYEITDEVFIEEIRKHKNNETCLLNVPIGYVAIVAKASIECNYDGYVQAKAANRQLLEYYIRELDAKFIGGYCFYLDDIAAKKLLDKYNWREE